MIGQSSILAVQTIYKAEEQRRCRADLTAFSPERSGAAAGRLTFSVRRHCDEWQVMHCDYSSLRLSLVQAALSPVVAGDQTVTVMLASATRLLR